MNSTSNKAATKPTNRRMGSSNSHRKGVLIIDNDGNESFRSKRESLEDCLIRISNHKAKSSKEEPFSSIVEALSMGVKTEFVKKNFATLLYNCLLCIKKSKGYVKELVLALQIIGLLVMIVEDEDNAHEIYQDSISVLSQVLESGSKNKDNLRILNCLGIVTFFGSYNADETQQVMQMIWKFLQFECNSDVKVAAISSWSVLLSTMEVWNINQKDWQGTISFLLNMLKDDSIDESVHVAASEALALIFEINCIEKFSYNNVKQDLKDEITEKLRCLNARTEIDDVLEFFENEKFSKTYAKIGKDKLVLSTWCQRIQHKFMKGFLGEDVFVKHMRQNENMQAVFEFTPTKKNVASDKVSLEREEVSISFFHPKVEIKDDGSMLPFVTKEAKLSMDKMNGRGPNSFLKKARTLLMNKRRMLSQREKHQLYNDD